MGRSTFRNAAPVHLTICGIDGCPNLPTRGVGTRCLRHGGQLVTCVVPLPDYDYSQARYYRPEGWTRNG